MGCPLGEQPVQSPWNDPAAGPLLREYIVQLYREERFVVEAIAIFAGQGLGKDGAVVLVATPAHLEAVERRLADVGLSVDGLERSGQLMCFDAATLLARFMVDDMPAPELFRDVVADIVRRCGRTVGTPIFACMGKWHSGHTRVPEAFPHGLSSLHPCVIPLEPSV